MILILLRNRKTLFETKKIILNSYVIMLSDMAVDARQSTDKVEIWGNINVILEQDDEEIERKVYSSTEMRQLIF